MKDGKIIQPQDQIVFDWKYANEAAREKDIKIQNIKVHFFENF